MARNHTFKRIKRYSRKSRLSLFEKISLKYSGSRDARHLLPREDEEGYWTSPTIQKELNACSEVQDMIYHTLQENQRDSYREANCLASLLCMASEKRSDLEKTFPKPLTEVEENLRECGEAELTDSQVIRRRQREYLRQCENVQMKIDEIVNEAENNVMRLVELHASIKQAESEASILADKIYCHAMQRIEFYWNAASYVSHRLKRTIPAAFAPYKVSDVADNYRKLHEDDDNRIEMIISEFTSREVA